VNGVLAKGPFHEVHGALAGHLAVAFGVAGGECGVDHVRR
jgi:hypothetical protein